MREKKYFEGISNKFDIMSELYWRIAKNQTLSCDVISEPSEINSWLTAQDRILNSVAVAKGWKCKNNDPDRVAKLV